MSRQSRILSCVVLLAVIGAGCGKRAEQAAADTPSSAPTASVAKPAVPAPAPTAAASLAATSGEAISPATATAPAPAPVANPAPATSPAPAPAVAPDAGASPEAVRRKNEIEWALKLDEIKNDANGQWASHAKASSVYNDAQGTAAYSASQASGAPNVENYGSSNAAWTSKTADAGIEWLELEYAKPVHATMVRVRESNGAGAIIKVEVFDEQGGAHTVWSGADSTKGLNFLIVEFPKTAFKTNRVKLTLATNVVPGWSAIDAVQLVGTEQ
jgi:hypothetical protein